MNMFHFYRSSSSQASVGISRCANHASSPMHPALNFIRTIFKEANVSEHFASGANA